MYITLLLKHMSDLEPDVGVGERTGRVTQDAVEALETLRVLALLLVNDTQAEQDLVRLIEI